MTWFMWINGAALLASSLWVLISLTRFRTMASCSTCVFYRGGACSADGKVIHLPHLTACSGYQERPANRAA